MESRVVLVKFTFLGDEAEPPSWSCFMIFWFKMNKKKGKKKIAKTENALIRTQEVEGK